ncbi:MAG: site-specific DNA-methyltransferase [Nanoarchaeota archaeon]|nr:site-specific DNA-methyltransferase [Nanoarchaeota archaeon]
MAKIKGLNKGGLDKNQTELTWSNKKTEVDHTILPFQIVENINEPKDKQRGLSTFIEPKKKEEWINKLIWGDNKFILSSLLPKFAGKIKLIYIDPPFDVGADFSFKTLVGDIELIKEQSLIEEKAYRDTWGKGTDSYLQMMYDRLVLMRELLSYDGSIYVHCDWHVGHYLKIIMDEIFGKENFRNELIVRRIRKNVREREKVPRLNVGTDSILFYAKSSTHLITPPLKEEKKEERWHSFEASGFRTGMDYDLFGHKPRPGNHWRWTKEKAEESIKKGILRPNKSTKKPEYLIPASTHVLRDNLWEDMTAYSFKYDYPTEKNENFIKLIIEASSNEGDIVADFFCGSGTAGVVSEKLKRNWIMADLGKFAIHVTRKRLLDTLQCKPFEVLNLGNYQRHKFKEKGKDTVSQYIKFILDMYRAKPISGHQYIHGKKANRLVHIGAVDSMITEKEIRNCMGEAKSIGTKSIDVLGWDFEMGLHDTFTQVIARNEKMDIKLIQIPKEALEVKDAIKEEVKFFEMPYLDVKDKVAGKKVSLDISDFVIKNTEYIPEDVQGNIKDYTDLIDYWAIDWDFKDDTFHNQWQSFRTKKEPKLDTKTTHSYSQKGNYKILVKIIDIFGNDTNKLIEVKIK